MRGFSNRFIVIAGLILSIVFADSAFRTVAWSQETPALQNIIERYDPGKVSGAATRTASDQLLVVREQIAKEKLYVIILSGLLVSSLIIILLFVYKTTHTARDIVNASGLVVIIFGTIFLVILVDTDEQLTGGIGILGAIAGYLFGTLQRRDSRTEGPG